MTRAQHSQHANCHSAVSTIGMIHYLLVNKRGITLVLSVGVANAD